MANFTPPVPRLLGLEMAAAYLGISPRMLDNLWRRGSLPAPHRIGRRMLWDRKVLDYYVDRLSPAAFAPSIDQCDDWSKI